MARRNPYAKPDGFTRNAKERGYPARSVFKLEEMDRRLRLFRSGMRVLDLGAAPGSWSLYASQRIGPKGRLLAVDLEPLRVALPPHATFVQGDALTLEDGSLSAAGPYQVVLSDMAPRTTGNRLVDQARSFDLFQRALAVAATLAEVGGTFVGKLFMGDDFETARAELRRHFDADRIVRPESTRSTSFEVFLVGLGKRPS